MPDTGGNILGYLRNADVFKKSIAALLVFFLLLKALTPVGYMPDMKALQEGALKITICTAYGFENLIVDSNGNVQDSEQQHPKTKTDFCPFGWIPHVALTVFSTFLLPPFFDASEKLLAFQKLFLSEPRHTLAQGRAPPALI